MATNNDISSLFEKYTQIEHEIKLLQSDKKQLLLEFKDKIDPHAFQSALRAAKIKAKIKPQEKTEFEQILHILENQLCIESLE